jgi:hypothetical protein
MNNLAETRPILGDIDGARELFEQALAGRQRVLGDDHPDTLASMNNLAAVRRDLGGTVAIARRSFVRTWLAVAVLAAGMGVGRWRISAGSVGLEGSGVTFDELIKPADDGELR